jgi:hypothetical protein
MAHRARPLLFGNQHLKSTPENEGPQPPLGVSTVSRTLYVQDDWPEFLRVFVERAASTRPEQIALDFAVTVPEARNVSSFIDMDEAPLLARSASSRGGVCSQRTCRRLD